MSNPYRKHALVCTYGKTCATQESESIWRALKQRIREREFEDDVRITRSGCMGQCGYGPIACIYPDNVWYAALSTGDVDPLLDHLIEGKIHEPRVYHPRALGNKKLPES